ncbi:MAG: nicotinate-nucleotide diphosphorylase (carboxylating), partial [Mucilaginibacter polytrichastri]|nr:nicotinate-nucleotide diphosphorylase (carboxylating) [Mucilaginibacter polytrichastri]
MQNEEPQKIITSFIQNALAEDVGDGDHTSLATIPAEAKGKARLLVKEKCTIAGVELAGAVFAMVDPGLSVDYFHADGDEVQVGDEIFRVEGSARSILKAERLVLNCMQRM